LLGDGRVHEAFIEQVSPASLALRGFFSSSG
jgi:hypothetical protein